MSSSSLVGKDSVSGIDRGAARLQEVARIRPRAAEVYVFEIPVNGVLSATVQSDRPLDVCLVGETEWLRWEDSGRNPHIVGASLVSSAGAKYSRLSWKVPDVGNSYAKLVLMLANRGSRSATAVLDVSQEDGTMAGPRAGGPTSDASAETPAC